MSNSSNMVLLETKTIGAGGASSFDFTGITQTGYTDLKIVVSYRGSLAQVYSELRVRFNNSTSGYTQKAFYGDGSTAAVSAFEAFSFGVGSNATANTFSNDTIYIPNYTGSTYKSWASEFAGENNATNAFAGIYAGLWSNTAAITSVKLEIANSGTILEGSTASLYGIKSLNKNVGPKATGGIITTAGGYAIHTFYSSGTFTPTQALTNVEYLVIAGGGSGGSDLGGGGGAGGYRSSVTGESSGGGAAAETKLSLTSGTGYTVTVGAGAPVPTSGQVGSNGSNSVFGSITSIGGGAGGKYANYGNGESNGSSGGSGGGGGLGDLGSSANGGSGTANQGYAGGSGRTSTPWSPGGGGGAGSAGVSATTTKAGDGGAGVTSSITGTAVARAGGGGGALGTDASAVSGAATAGGGAGGGALPSNGVSGTANTGGGGGGCRSNGSATGGAGGSGIVIVRYAL